MNMPQKEYNPYYQRYIDYAHQYLISNSFQDSLNQNIDFYNSIPNDKWNYRYAEGKWSIADILLHINDTERIMSYRALRISRGDLTSIPGFEQDDYVASALADKRNFRNLIEEFKTIRQASLSLFKSFSEEQLLKIGVASNSDISVRALKAIIIGHQIHHNNIIKKLYL